jgi:hypothetical protein
MLPYVLPERAKVPPEDGKSGLGNLGEHLLTTHSAEVGGCDPVYQCRWDRLCHP